MPAQSKTIIHALFATLILTGLEAIERGTRPRTKNDTRKEAAEARAWFENPRDTHLFSFVSVCRVLGLDPERGRELARRAAEGKPWRERLTPARPARQPVSRSEASMLMTPGEQRRYREVTKGAGDWQSGWPG